MLRAVARMGCCSFQGYSWCCGQWRGWGWYSFRGYARDGRSFVVRPSTQRILDIVLCSWIVFNDENSEGEILFFFLRQPSKRESTTIQEKSSSFILFLRQGHHSFPSIPSPFHLLSVSQFFLAGSAGATSTAPQSPVSPNSPVPSTFIINDAQQGRKLEGNR